MNELDVFYSYCWSDDIADISVHLFDLRCIDTTYRMVGVNYKGGFFNYNPTITTTKIILNMSYSRYLYLTAKISRMINANIDSIRNDIVCRSTNYVTLH